MESSRLNQSETSAPSVWLELRTLGAVKDCRDHFIQSHHSTSESQAWITLPMVTQLLRAWNVVITYVSLSYLGIVELTSTKHFSKYIPWILLLAGKAKKKIVPMFKCIWETACIAVSDSQFIQLLNKYSFIVPYASDTVPGTKKWQWNLSLKSFVLVEEVNIKELV